ncbi:MAG: response regulator [Desulfuromonadaceae bacterium]
MNILIVDDDELSRVMLSEMLEELGSCDAAAGGREGLGLFHRAFAAGKPYELICLDVIMPDIDGFQLLRQIRSTETENSVALPDAARIIMISSMSDLEHIMASFDAACEAYMIKPLERQELFGQLEQWGLTN